jgi:hypothetical protein
MRFPHKLSDLSPMKTYALGPNQFTSTVHPSHHLNASFSWFLGFLSLCKFTNSYTLNGEDMIDRFRSALVFSARRCCRRLQVWAPRPTNTPWKHRLSSAWKTPIKRCFVARWCAHRQTNQLPPLAWIQGKSWNIFWLAGADWITYVRVI